MRPGMQLSATGKVDKRQVFESHELFSLFSPAELERLISFSHARVYAAGEMIFEKGSPGTGLMAVLSGRVRISSPSPEGREVVLNIIHPGQVFGEIALLDGKERTADATAMESCELLILERRDFVPFLEHHPDICLRLIAVLCERLRRTTEQVEDVLFLDLGGRLAKTLLHLAGVHGRPSAKGIALAAKLSQRDLASMIGASRESVNRQLSLWEDQGLIARDKGAIILVDSQGLLDLTGTEY